MHIYAYNIYKMKIGIIGFGAFTKELLPSLRNFDIFLEPSYYQKIQDQHLEIKNKYKCDIFYINQFNTKKYKALITNVDLQKRKEAVELLPNDTEYHNFIHPSVKILDNNITFGKSTIICANSVLTTNIKIGDFCQFNVNNFIGHDSKIGDYVTTANFVNILGYCEIGNNIYMGANSTVRNRTKICDDVIIGMCSGVIKDITEKGTYIGTPCKKLIK